MSYIASRDDGAKWLNYVDLLHEIDDMLDGGVGWIKWGVEDTNIIGNSGNGSGGGGDDDNDNDNDEREKPINSSKKKKKRISKTVLVSHNDLDSKEERKLIRHELMLKRFSTLYPNLIRSSSVQFKEINIRDANNMITNVPPNDDVLKSIKKLMLNELTMNIMKPYHLTETCRRMNETYVRAAAIKRRSSLRNLHDDLSGTTDGGSTLGTKSDREIARVKDDLTFDEKELLLLIHDNHGL
jgi:hypothetical protein